MFNDWVGWIKLIVILVFVAAWITQLLYRSFVKPVSQAGGRGEGPEGLAGRPRPAAALDPAREIRDFLAEIRGEAAAPAESEAPPARRVPEGVRPGSPLAAPVPPPLPTAPAAEPPRRRVQPLSPARHARRPPGGEQHGEGSRERSQAPHVPSAAPERAPGAVHEYLDGLTKLEKAAGDRIAAARTTASAAAARVRRGPSIPRLGFSLRDALLGQVILGPPRCRSRRYVRRPAGGGRPGRKS